MRASSQDVRQQVLRAIDEGKSRAQIIERFQVSRATIKRSVKQRRETGTLLPRPIPGRPARKGAALQMGVQELLEAHPDASQNEYCQWWEAEHGCEPSFDEPGDPCDWLDAPKGTEHQSERAIEDKPAAPAPTIKTGTCS